ncbi:MAG: hypothetical protein ACTSV7_06675 [Candidatus Baldrarchaeia archaeon]
MANNCCNLVGNLPIDIAGCIISVNMNSSTESSKVCDATLVIGPTIGNVSIVGYATDLIHYACPGRASVTIPWIRKWDCENDETHFIFSGQGRSSISGDVAGLAFIGESLEKSYRVVSASSQGGPSSLYTDDCQHDGYGLTYNGNPFDFTTSEESDVVFSNFGVGDGDMYLQSFSLDCTPGAIPTASYSFMFKVGPNSVC